MSIKATTKIGLTNITVEATDIKDLFKQIGVFTELPNQCSCGSQNIRLKHRVAKSYDFYSLKCECNKEFALGQMKEGGGLFPKGPWEVPQRSNDGGGRDDSRSGGGHQQSSSNYRDDDDIPF
jgi:hypothetical protein